MKIILFLLLSSVLAIKNYSTYQHPIIGVFTLPYKNTATSKTNYLPASYIKFIQMSGAQVVPIFSFSSTETILERMGQINGLLIPGGKLSFDVNSQEIKNIDAIYRYVKQQNEKGNKFPIFGICMGFQLLAFLSSNYNSSILTQSVGNRGVLRPISLSSQSYIFDTLTTSQKTRLQTGDGILYFTHEKSLTLQTYKNNYDLRSFWEVTATSTASSNQQIVAAFEAKSFPFYGVQFHPEKNPFEWEIQIDRSYQTIQIVQTISNNFVEAARQNTNIFEKNKFKKESISNFETKTSNPNFSQIYIFQQ